MVGIYTLSIDQIQST